MSDLPENPYKRFFAPEASSAPPAVPPASADGDISSDSNPYARFFAGTAAGVPSGAAPAPSGTSLRRLVGAGLTGAGDVLTSSLTAIPDYLIAGINALHGASGNMPPGDLGVDPASGVPIGVPPPPGAAPAPGDWSARPLLPPASQALREWSDRVGAEAGYEPRVEPRNEPERLAAALGGAAASLVPGMAVGRGARLLGETGRLSEALANPGVLGTAATIAGGGTGELARSAASQVAPESPLLQGAAELIGNVAGATALPAAAIGAGRMVSGLWRPFSASGQEQLAGRLLREQQANELARQNPQEAAIQQNAGLVGNPGTRSSEEISAEAADALDRIRAEARQREAAAWDQVDRQAPVPLEPYTQAHSDYVGSQSLTRQQRIPGDIGELLSGLQSKYGDSVPLGEIQDLRSDLLGRIRQAQAGGDSNQAAALGGLEKAMFRGGSEDLPQAVGIVPGLDPAASATYQAALDASREFAQTFKQGALGRIFRTDATGADRVGDSAVLKTLLGPGPSQTERVNAFLGATAPTGAAGDTLREGARQNARDWFLSEMLDNARTTNLATGETTTGARQLQRHLDNNQPLVDSDLFNPAHRDALNAMVENAAAADRLRAGGGIPAPVRPLEQLQGGGAPWAAAMGLPPALPKIAALAGGLAPVALSRAIGVSPELSDILLWSAISGSGALGGHGIGSHLLPRLYAGPTERVSNLLRDAISGGGADEARREAAARVQGIAAAPAAQRGPLAPPLLSSVLRAGMQF